jgi:hypothetical protein
MLYYGFESTDAEALAKWVAAQPDRYYHIHVPFDRSAPCRMVIDVDCDLDRILIKDEVGTYKPLLNDGQQVTKELQHLCLNNVLKWLNESLPMHCKTQHLLKLKFAGFDWMTAGNWQKSFIFSACKDAKISFRLCGPKDGIWNSVDDYHHTMKANEKLCEEAYNDPTHKLHEVAYGVSWIQQKREKE